MSNFDKWFKDYHSNNEAYAEQLTKDAFEAGAASRQAEINCLKVELDAANERALMLLDHKNKMVDKLQGEVDELQEMYIQQGLTIAKLQKRIDEALSYFDQDRSISISGYIKLHEILKGESE